MTTPTAFSAAGLLNPIDDFAFVVRLVKLEVEAVPGGGGAAQFFHVAEGRVAVDFRLARAEQIEIGSVEDVDRLRHARPTPGCCMSRKSGIRFSDKDMHKQRTYRGASPRLGRL